MTRADAARLRDPDGKLPAVAFPGGYSILYLTTDGDTLCSACVNDPENPIHFVDEEEFDDWTIESDFIHWEGEPDECAHCGRELPSEYGIPGD